MLDVIARGATDTGKVRKLNEDAIGIDEAQGFYLLADGMGGREGGAAAAKAAIATVHGELVAARPIFDRFRDDGGEASRDAALAAIVAAFEKTCARVYDLGGEGKSRGRMGSTLDAVVRVGDRVLVGHVGDGRLYLMRGGKCYCLTEDHSLIAEQVKAGNLTPQQAQESAFRGVLTRAIGTHKFVKVDTLILDLSPADLLVMCSDGLYRHVPNEQILRLATEGVAPATIGKLVAQANAAGGDDNISVILIGCGGAPVKPAAAAPTLAQGTAPRAQARIEAISALPLFQHLNYRERVAVLAIAQPRIYEAGTTIVEQGTAGREMFLIVDGEAVVERDRVTIATLGAGGHFGEMAIVDNGARSATVRASRQTDVLTIGQAEISALMRQDPALGLKVLWNLAQVLSTRLRKTSAEVIELQMEDVTADAQSVPFAK